MAKYHPNFVLTLTFSMTVAITAALPVSTLGETSSQKIDDPWESILELFGHDLGFDPEPSTNSSDVSRQDTSLDLNHERDSWSSRDSKSEERGEDELSKKLLEIFSEHGSPVLDYLDDEVYKGLLDGVGIISGGDENREEQNKAFIESHNSSIPSDLPPQQTWRDETDHLLKPVNFLTFTLRSRPSTTKSPISQPIGSSANPQSTADTTRQMSDTMSTDQELAKTDGESFTQGNGIKTAWTSVNNLNRIAKIKPSATTDSKETNEDTSGKNRFDQPRATLPSYSSWQATKENESILKKSEKLRYSDMPVTSPSYTRPDAESTKSTIKLVAHDKSLPEENTKVTEKTSSTNTVPISQERKVPKQKSDVTNNSNFPASTKLSSPVKTTLKGNIEVNTESSSSPPNKKQSPRPTKSGHINKRVLRPSNEIESPKSYKRSAENDQDVAGQTSSDTKNLRPGTKPTRHLQITQSATPVLELFHGEKSKPRPTLMSPENTTTSQARLSNPHDDLERLDSRVSQIGWKKFSRISPALLKEALQRVSAYMKKKLEDKNSGFTDSFAEEITVTLPPSADSGPLETDLNKTKVGSTGSFQQTATLSSSGATTVKTVQTSSYERVTDTDSNTLHSKDMKVNNLADHGFSGMSHVNTRQSDRETTVLKKEKTTAIIDTLTGSSTLGVGKGRQGKEKIHLFRTTLLPHGGPSFLQNNLKPKDYHSSPVEAPTLTTTQSDSLIGKNIEQDIMVPHKSTKQWSKNKFATVVSPVNSLYDLSDVANFSTAKETQETNEAASEMKHSDTMNQSSTAIPHASKTTLAPYIEDQNGTMKLTSPYIAGRAEVTSIEPTENSHITTPFQLKHSNSHSSIDENVTDFKSTNKPDENTTKVDTPFAENKTFVDNTHLFDPNREIKGTSPWVSVSNQKPTLETSIKDTSKTTDNFESNTQTMFNDANNKENITLRDRVVSSQTRFESSYQTNSTSENPTVNSTERPVFTAAMIPMAEKQTLTEEGEGMASTTNEPVEQAMNFPTAPKNETQKQVSDLFEHDVFYVSNKPAPSSQKTYFESGGDQANDSSRSVIDVSPGEKRTFIPNTFVELESSDYSTPVPLLRESDLASNRTYVSPQFKPAGTPTGSSSDMKFTLPPKLREDTDETKVIPDLQTTTLSQIEEKSDLLKEQSENTPASTSESYYMDSTNSSPNLVTSQPYSTDSSTKYERAQINTDQPQTKPLAMLTTRQPKINEAENLSKIKTLSGFSQSHGSQQDTQTSTAATNMPTEIDSPSASSTGEIVNIYSPTAAPVSNYRGAQYTKPNDYIALTTISVLTGKEFLSQAVLINDTHQALQNENLTDSLQTTQTVISNSGALDNDERNATADTIIPESSTSPMKPSKDIIKRKDWVVERIYAQGITKKPKTQNFSEQKLARRLPTGGTLEGFKSTTAILGDVTANVDEYKDTTHPKLQQKIDLDDRAQSKTNPVTGHVAQNNHLTSQDPLVSNPSTQSSDRKLARASSLFKLPTARTQAKARNAIQTETLPTTRKVSSPASEIPQTSFTLSNRDPVLVKAQQTLTFNRQTAPTMDISQGVETILTTDKLLKKYKKQNSGLKSDTVITKSPYIGLKKSKAPFYKGSVESGKQNPRPTKLSLFSSTLHQDGRDLTKEDTQTAAHSLKNEPNSATEPISTDFSVRDDTSSTQTIGSTSTIVHKETHNFTNLSEYHERTTDLKPEQSTTEKRKEDLRGEGRNVPLTIYEKHYFSPSTFPNVSLDPKSVYTVSERTVNDVLSSAPENNDFEKTLNKTATVPEVLFTYFTGKPQDRVNNGIPRVFTIAKNSSENSQDVTSNRSNIIVSDTSTVSNSDSSSSIHAVTEKTQIPVSSKRSRTPPKTKIEYTKTSAIKQDYTETSELEKDNTKTVGFEQTPTKSSVSELHHTKGPGTGLLSTKPPVTTINYKEQSARELNHTHQLAIEKLNQEKQSVTELSETYSFMRELDHTKSPVIDLDGIKTFMPDLDHTKSPVTDLDGIKSIVTDLDHTKSSATDLDGIKPFVTELDYTKSPATDLYGTKAFVTELNHTKSPATDLDGIKTFVTELNHTKSTPTEEDNPKPSVTEIDKTEQTLPREEQTKLSVTEQNFTNSPALQLDHTKPPAVKQDPIKTPTPEFDHTKSSASEQNDTISPVTDLNSTDTVKGGEIIHPTQSYTEEIDRTNSSTRERLGQRSSNVFDAEVDQTTRSINKNVSNKELFDGRHLDQTQLDTQFTKTNFTKSSSVDETYKESDYTVPSFDSGNGHSSPAGFENTSDTQTSPGRESSQTNVSKSISVDHVELSIDDIKSSSNETTDRTELVTGHKNSHVTPITESQVENASNFTTESHNLTLSTLITESDHTNTTSNDKLTSTKSHENKNPTAIPIERRTGRDNVSRVHSTTPPSAPGDEDTTSQWLGESSAIMTQSQEPETKAVSDTTTQLLEDTEVIESVLSLQAHLSTTYKPETWNTENETTSLQGTSETVLPTLAAILKTDSTTENPRGLELLNSKNSYTAADATSVSTHLPVHHSVTPSERDRKILNNLGKSSGKNKTQTPKPVAPDRDNVTDDKIIPTFSHLTITTEPITNHSENDFYTASESNLPDSKLSFSSTQNTSVSSFSFKQFQNTVYKTVTSDTNTTITTLTPDVSKTETSMENFPSSTPLNLENAERDWASRSAVDATITNQNISHVISMANSLSTLSKDVTEPSTTPPLPVVQKLNQISTALKSFLSPKLSTHRPDQITSRSPFSTQREEDDELHPREGYMSSTALSNRTPKSAFEPSQGQKVEEKSFTATTTVFDEYRGVSTSPYTNSHVSITTSPLLSTQNSFTSKSSDQRQTETSTATSGTSIATSETSTATPGTSTATSGTSTATSLATSEPSTTTAVTSTAIPGTSSATSLATSRTSTATSGTSTAISGTANAAYDTSTPSSKTSRAESKISSTSFTTSESLSSEPGTLSVNSDAHSTTPGTSFTPSQFSSATSSSFSNVSGSPSVTSSASSTLLDTTSPKTGISSESPFATLANTTPQMLENASRRIKPALGESNAVNSISGKTSAKSSVTLSTSATTPPTSSKTRSKPDTTTTTTMTTTTTPSPTQQGLVSTIFKPSDNLSLPRFKSEQYSTITRTPSTEDKPGSQSTISPSVLSLMNTPEAEPEPGDRLHNLDLINVVTILETLIDPTHMASAGTRCLSGLSHQTTWPDLIETLKNLEDMKMTKPVLRHKFETCVKITDLSPLLWWKVFSLSSQYQCMKKFQEEMLNFQQNFLPSVRRLGSNPLSTDLNQVGNAASLPAGQLWPNNARRKPNINQFDPNGVPYPGRNLPRDFSLQSHLGPRSLFLNQQSIHEPNSQGYRNSPYLENLYYISGPVSFNNAGNLNSGPELVRGPAGISSDSR